MTCKRGRQEAASMKQRTLFDMNPANAHTGQPTVEDKQHTQDSHCRLDPVGVCLDCGVYHAEPCSNCGAKGYHLDDCPMISITGRMVEPQAIEGGILL